MKPKFLPNADLELSKKREVDEKKTKEEKRNVSKK